MAAFQFPDPALNQEVVNPITGSTYQWKFPPGKWVVTATPKTNASVLIWEGDNPPNPPEDYKLWYSTDTLELYFYYCDGNGVCAWIPTSKPITLLDDLDTAVSELRTDLYKVNIATAENENRIGRTVEFSDTAPTIYPDDVFDGVSYPSELNYKFWYDTARLELLILFRDEDGDDSYVPVSIPLEALPDPGVSTEVFTYTTGRLQTAIEENYLHNLAQDTSIANIKNDIIELEEEIDAIAPSVERGKWRFTAVGTVANPGQFTMYDADFGSGQPTGLFKNVKSIWFNQQDSEGVVHGFADVDDGELLQIFIEDSAEFALFEVVGQAHDETQGASSFWVIDVNFVRTNEDSTSVAPSELCRFKVFMAPSGGDASDIFEYVNDRLEGVASRYILDNVQNNPVTNGQFSANNPFYLNVREFSFGAKDLDGGVSKKLLDGDIIEIFDSIDNAKIRYKITDRSNAPSVVKVEHLSGIVNFTPNRIHQVQILPGSEEVEVEQALIQVLPGNPANPEVGDAWFSTNQNTFIIKIA